MLGPAKLHSTGLQVASGVVLPVRHQHCHHCPAPLGNPSQLLFSTALLAGQDAACRGRRLRSHVFRVLEWPHEGRQPGDAPVGSLSFFLSFIGGWRGRGLQRAAGRLRAAAPLPIGCLACLYVGCNLASPAACLKPPAHPPYTCISIPSAIPAAATVLVSCSLACTWVSSIE